MAVDCAFAAGRVAAVADKAGHQRLEVCINNQYAKAVNYPSLTGSCDVGDRVVLNTTAECLQLGTGGDHFVMAVLGKSKDMAGAGHIMKLRYTPSQGRVLAVEEPDSPYHDRLADQVMIRSMPVLVGTLHSMLLPVALGFASERENGRLVYLMSDGGALPLALSRTVPVLQERGLLGPAITFGHAFGGDFEAVTIFSALAAAQEVCHADAAIVLMGPGVVGTGTPWGTTALEQGVYLNAVASLAGRPVGVIRVNEAEHRARHQGISHHCMTALGKVTHVAVDIPLPRLLQSNTAVMTQLHQLTNHRLHWVETEALQQQACAWHEHLQTMGRSFDKDPAFFHTAFAAGVFAAQVCNTHERRGANIYR